MTWKSPVSLHNGTFVLTEKGAEILEVVLGIVIEKEAL